MDDQSAEEPKRRERSDARENRRLLLAVAKQRFAEQGVTVTTMQEIARIAGVGQGTIYRHFAHKGELFLALIRDDVAKFQVRLSSLFEGGASALSPLRRLDRLIVERIRLIDEAGTSPRRGERFRGPFDSWVHAQVVALLTQAVEQNEFVDLDVAVTADLMLAMMSGGRYLDQRTTCGYSQEQIVAAIRRMCIDGLRHQPQIQP